MANIIEKYSDSNPARKSYREKSNSHAESETFIVREQFFHRFQYLLKTRDVLDELTITSTAMFFILSRTRVVDDGLETKWCFWRRRRYIIVMIMFLCEATKSILRSNMSVAVFPMTENRSSVNENGTIIYVEDFDWDVKTRGFLLSAFFYGYVVTHIPGGILALKYGGCKLFGLGIGLTSFTTILTQLAVNINFYVLIVLRIFEGMCEGLLRPSLEIISVRWFPTEERSSLVGVILSGGLWGEVTSFALSSVIGHNLGWPAIFYITGGIGILSYITWLLLVKDYPKQDHKISPSELAYIDNSLGYIQQRKRKLASVPYIKIFTSRPVLAIIVNNTAYSWSYCTFATQLPAYIKDVLHTDAEHSGYLTSLIIAVNAVVIYVFSPLADFFIRKKILSATLVRKISVCGTMATIAVFSLVIQQTTQTSTVVGCMIIIYSCIGFGFVQILVNTLETTAGYCSVVCGVYFTIFALCGIISPTLTGYLTQNRTAEEWRIVFYIHVGICMMAAVIYGLLASGELQPWANEKTSTVHEDNANNRANENV